MKNVKCLENERIDDLDCKGMKIIQKNDGFCFGMDSILIANFAKVAKKDSIIADLGTGTGIISILMAAKNEKVDKIYGFDIQPDMIEMASRSVKMNELDDKVILENLDIVGMS